MIYAIFGALVVGLSLGVFGSGGSILTVPILVYLLHHPDKTSIAESLAIVGTIALVSAMPYARARLVDWRTALVFGIPGMVGTYLGALIAGFVPGYVQLLVFAGVMLLAAVKMWRRSRGVSAGEEPDHHAPRRSVVKIGAEGIGLGVLTGFVGVGGGFLIVPALVLMGGLSMRRAVATSLFIIALQSGAGFWKYLHVLEATGATVDWTTIGVFVACGVVGSFVGKSLNQRVNQRALQRGFAVFLVVMAGFIAIKETMGLVASQGDRTETQEVGE